MKVLHLSTSDLDGGAARAAHRLHQGLRSLGVDSTMLVRNKQSNDHHVLSERSLITKVSPVLDRLFVASLSKSSSSAHNPFSIQFSPNLIHRRIREISPDIIHLHWVCDSFIRIESLRRIRIPIVWTLHDMWPITGGCHYSGNCDKYTKHCGACPRLGSASEMDLSSWIFQRKAHAWKHLNVTLVSPSQWLAGCIRSSALFGSFPVKVIPNGIDHTSYQPLPQSIARQILGLPQNKFLLLFGAGSGTGDPRKGFHLLLAALKNLANLNLHNKLELVIFGDSAPDSTADLPFHAHHLGRFSDQLSLRLIYAASNVFVAPSIEDNLPNTILEAFACGTPSIGFNIGGVPDMIIHKHNGYLAKALDPIDLSQGIQWIMDNSEMYEIMRKNAASTVLEKFNIQLQATRSRHLYQSILSDSKRLYSCIEETN